MFIAFSTSPKDTASDKGENSGPYAQALASELIRPGQDHLNLFQNVKVRVFNATGGQRPWENNGLLHLIYFAGETTPVTRPSKPTGALDNSLEQSRKCPEAENEAKKVTLLI